MMGKEELLLLWSDQSMRVKKRSARELDWRRLVVVTITEPSKSYHISSVNFTLPDVVVSENICEVVSLTRWCHFKSYTH